MPIFILSLLIQLFLVMHILKTGRNTNWIMVIVFIPFIGLLAYFILEILPELSNSRSGQKSKRKIESIINPNREIDEATRNFSLNDSVDNTIRLGEELYHKGSFVDAEELFKNGLKGTSANDPDLLHGCAKCAFKLENYKDAKSRLDQLIESNPDYKNQDAHLLYARSLDKLKETEPARHEFETLYKYFSGPEASFYYGKFLQGRNETEKADEIFTEIVEKTKTAGKYYKSQYKEYIKKAKLELHR